MRFGSFSHLSKTVAISCVAWVNFLNEISICYFFYDDRTTPSQNILLNRSYGTGDFSQKIQVAAAAEDQVLLAQRGQEEVRLRAISALDGNLRGGPVAGQSEPLFREDRDPGSFPGHFTLPDKGFQVIFGVPELNGNG